GGLRGRGLVRGDRVAVLARNSAAQARVFHACYWSGLLPTPLNWRLSASEIAAQIEDCRPTAIFFEEEFEALLPADRKGSQSFWLSDIEALSAGAQAAPPAEASADDGALLLYTGGTTGRAKGVLLSHGNVVANAFQVLADMKFDERSRYLHIAPMFHSADLLGTAVTILGGGHAYLPAFDVDAFLSVIERRAITHTMLAPTMIKMLLASGKRADLRALKRIIYGSSPMDAATIAKTCAYFAPAGILQGYGLTETSPLLTVLGSEIHERIANGETGLARSAGRPLPGVELRLVDGEVLARGPNIARAYWNAPDAEAEAFEGDWFRTGDIGEIGPDGALTLRDRMKDMIVTGGENVYSAEVEEALLEHPSVREVAVIGLPDPLWGEAVTAVVVPAEEAFDADGLTAFCRTKLGAYKVPKRFLVRASLPRSALGKILKRQLRDDLKETP
ncbi:MAG: AMP-binding protein, partial [Pseudomonadota bacterium]